MGLSPVQEPAPVPCTDLPPQSILKGILSGSHCLVNIADLGQGHLADDLWWSRAVRPSLDSVYIEAPHHPLPWPPGRAQRGWLANRRAWKGVHNEERQRDLLCFHIPGSFFSHATEPKQGNRLRLHLQG